MQVRAGEKENEISVAPSLLRCLDLRGKVVIGDAMHTLRADIAQVFVPRKPKPEGGITPAAWQSCRIVTKGHGRKDQTTTTEIVYGLTSRVHDLASPRVLLGWSRTYWGIEYSLYHRHDVTSQEDQTRVPHGRPGA